MGQLWPGASSLKMEKAAHGALIEKMNNGEHNMYDYQSRLV